MPLPRFGVLCSASVACGSLELLASSSEEEKADELHTHRFSFVHLQTLLTINHLRIFISHDSLQSHKKLYATFFIS